MRTRKFENITTGMGNMTDKKDNKKRDEVLKKMLQTPPVLNQPIKGKDSPKRS